jgi:hypothetical protein
VERFIRSAAIVTFASLFLTLGVTGCGSKYNDKVVGTWDWNIGPATVLLTINKDGTGTLKGPSGEMKLKWRIQRGNNFVFNDGSKDSGFLIESADADTIRGSDPKSPGQPIVWTRRK